MPRLKNKSYLVKKEKDKNRKRLQRKGRRTENQLSYGSDEEPSTSKYSSLCHQSTVSTSISETPKGVVVKDVDSSRQPIGRKRKIDNIDKKTDVINSQTVCKKKKISDGDNNDSWLQKYLLDQRKKLEQKRELNNASRRERRSIADYRQKENDRTNITKKERRISEVKDRENAKRNVSRKIRRSIPEEKDRENAKRNVSRKNKRSIPEKKDRENAKRNVSRKNKRSIPEKKDQENVKRNVSRRNRRSIPEKKDRENTKRNVSRKNGRSKPEKKDRENAKRNVSRKNKRKLEEFLSCENLKRKKWRHNQNRQKKEVAATVSSYRKRKSDLATQTQIFRDLLKRGDEYVCSSCKQTFFQHSVYSVIRKTYLEKGIPEKLINETLTGTCSVSDSEWVCKTCHKYIMDKKIPPMAECNGFSYATLPNDLNSLSPTQTEERCVALRIPFMQLKQLGAGKQFGIYGNTVNVPMDPSSVASALPRRFENTATIHLLFKRKLKYKSSLLHETVRPKVIYDLAKHFINNSQLYKEEGIQLDESWAMEKDIVKFASSDDLAALENTENGKLVRVTEDIESNSPNILSNREEETDSNLLVVNKEGEDDDDDEDDDWVEQTDEEASGSGNKDTLLQNLDFTDDGKHALQIAPGEKNHPVSLFLDHNAEEKAFPVLFAGQKRVDNDKRKVPVTYGTICKAELRNMDRRFSSSVSNIFFKLKKLQALQVKDIANTALRKTKNNTYTAGELKSSENINALLQNDEGFTFLRTMRSSPPYYQTKQRELFSMLVQLGLPTFFMTFSAAETHWLDLLGVLARKTHGPEYSMENVDQLNWMERCELIQKDPITCARHFHYRTQLFLNNILKSPNCPIGQVTDYFIRVEFQQRGSPHLHCLFWNNDSPVYGSSSEEDIIKFIDTHISCSTNVTEDDQQFIKLQKHRHTKSCKKQGKRLCRFGFPIPPMKETLILEPLPSEMSKDEILQHRTNYQKICTVIESLHADQDMEFEEFLEKCEVDKDQYILAVRSGLSKTKVFLRRSVSDIRVDAYNIHILKIWQANTDIQFVIDPYAVCVYIASYMMKSQRGMSMLLRNAAEEVKRGNFSIRERIRVISNKFLNHCEVSAQEATYLLLQLPLTQNSRDVIFINTSPPEKRIKILKPASIIQSLPDDSTEVTCSGMLDRYSQRPECMDTISLAQFAACFDRQTGIKKTTKETVDEIDITDNNVENIAAGTKIELSDGSVLRKRRVPKIIRSVNFSVRKDPELHYREQLMLFHPWREEICLQGSSSSFEEEYQKYEAEIQVAQKAFKAFSNENSLQEIMENVNQEILDDAMNEVAPVARQTEDDAEDDREECPSVLQPADESLQNYDVGLDIGGSNTSHTEIVIPYKLSDDEYIKLVRSLNDEQKKFFYFVLNKSKTDDKPFHVFLSGGAGVGKSHVLKAVYQALIRYYDSAGENPDDMKVAIAAPTGKAAYNVRGNTLHSLLNIPCCHALNNYMPLDHSSLNTLRCRFSKLKVLIIDEVSMVGIHMFNFINSRLQEIFECNIPFAGISLLLVGDLFQIKPVREPWIFSVDSSDYGLLATNFWLELVYFFELKTVMRQRDDADFAHLLNRLREGKHTDNDIHILSSRLVTKIRNPDLTNSVHLYSTNSLVDDFNETALSLIPGQIFVSKALDYIVGNVESRVRQTVLDLAKNLPAKKTQSLHSSLSLKVGAQYMIVSNVNTRDGLTNGATCRLMQITSVHNKPVLLWVAFPDQEIGSHTREDNKRLYNENINKDWTPIQFETRQFRVGKYKNLHVMRKQFPLKPAAAITIHKSQGSTLPKIAVSQKCRIQCHMVYVALSRVTSLQGLNLLDFNSKKIKIDEKVCNEMLRLRRNCQILFHQMPDENPKLSILSHNARSLHKHIEEYKYDIRFSGADIMFIQETWATDSDPKEYYSLEGFSLIQLPVQHGLHRQHCGSFAYVREGVEIESQECLKLQGIEIIKLSLQLTNEKILVAGFYCHPGTKVDIICAQIAACVIPETTTIILGDFNIDQMKTTNDTNKLLNFVYKLGLRNAHAEETTDYHSSIDHIYITSDQQCKCGTLECYWSDHKILWANI